MDDHLSTPAVIDLATARLEELERTELRALAAAVGDHLPIELVLRVDAIRRERRRIASDSAPLGAV